VTGVRWEAFICHEPGESTYSSVVKRVRMVEELIVYEEYGMGWFSLRSYNHLDVRIVKPCKQLFSSMTRLNVSST